MALATKQTQELRQRFALTPQMRQAITILQLSVMELKQVVQQELEDNPLLTEDVPEDATEQREEQLEQEEQAPEEIQEADDDSQQDAAETLLELDDNFSDYVNHRDVASGSREEQDRLDYRASLISRPITLEEHLRHQIILLDLTDSEREIIEHIIGNLDGNGYLRSTLEEIADQCESCVEDVDRLMRIVQRLDPPGVAARDLSECLLIQLRALGLQGSTAERIARDGLEALQHRKINQLRRELNLSLDDIRDALQELCTLDPKPGRNFGTDQAHYLQPDLFLEPNGAEGFTARLNDAELPRLHINARYRALLRNSKTAEATKDYVRERLNAALWVIKAIGQRQQTLSKVADFLVKHQREALSKGLEHLKPLTTKQVAEVVGVHESTVSRAVSKKYLQTPYGIIPLKSLFSRQLQVDTGPSVSPDRVKGEIQRMIETEQPSTPLSDQRIAGALQRMGYQVARRTVAKYREELDIASSSLRKRDALLNNTDHGHPATQ